MESIDQLLPSVLLAIGCLGIAQSLFLSTYLLTLKSGNTKANKFLAFVLLGLTIRIGKAVVLNFVYVGPWIRNLGLSGLLIVGPFLWLYGRALLQKENDFGVKDYWQLIPFFLYVAFSPVIPNRGDSVSVLMYAMIHAHWGIYLGLSWWLVLKKLRIGDRRLASWYRIVVIGVTLIFAMYVGIFLRIVPFYVLGATSFSFLIYLFSFVLLKKHVFVLEKYAGSSLDGIESLRIIKQLRSYFAAEHPYLNSRISLKAVAEQLEVNPRTLSQVINENDDSNFSDFVNSYRIETAKALLVSPASKDDKIATIAFESGFGNVTSFNVEFKSRVKVTPSQFRKQFTLAKA